MTKNIVICCDGTGNEYSENNTNVVGAFSSIERDNKQVAFYDTGVGTFNPLGMSLGPVSKKVGIIFGQAFGYGVKQNVQEAYVYLMDRYEAGDNVFIFGFSRGAYTARVLAGMLHKCGLLQKGSKNLIPYVMKMNFEEKPEHLVEGFKRDFCHTCKPHFVGVWDTVASIGTLHPTRHFKDDVLNHDVANGYHAISIDEKRKKFPISLWDESQKSNQQNTQQVWFAGVHSDIGGWYNERGLSDITLKWMLSNAEKCGLRLKKDWDRDLKCNPLGPIHESRTGFWKMWFEAHRSIPEGAIIHQSVIDRIEQSDYKVNLPTKYHVAS
ncbi:DUF2235 domain-containing protein [Paremcibacter congregatus]|uniref:T6SS Phospholipase effector Tle1-like catalytic domain-containing protein n=1 Tax=Paremcibacter congregatus TaxID=2043170 RepID=A0A2G4YQX7_9PROT|nr:DUF2235 domain-containing protein [Paremcibacter congregatus]PHZ84718.1 hypothetical protein CRD36_10555 [Paremcibacter congregatus]QDE28913.1 DUF2235 domain-containing protein [Paremcibacter congregatus]